VGGPADGAQSPSVCLSSSWELAVENPPRPANLSARAPEAARTDSRRFSLEDDSQTDNVLVGHEGRVVITDFGIARALKAADAEPGGDSTAMAALVGTPAYMAPEQVRGNTLVDTRADLYALGVMLFQLLTGELPFGGGSPIESALARLYEAPRDPLALRPELPGPLIDFLRRSLQVSPEARFQTAAEMGAALQGERPPGPGLAEYLRQRATTPRRALATAALQQTEPLSHAATFPAGASVRASSPLAMPLFHLAPGSRQLAVTVLLFRLPADQTKEYLAHGLTEEIIDRLSEAEGLLVTSFGVVRALREDQQDPGSLHQKLQAQVIVDGTLRVVGEGLSATVRLVEVARGLQLAVRRFERPDHNVLALALEIAQVLGGLLTVHIQQGQGDIVGDAVAVDLYMQARHGYHSMNSAEVAHSVDLFEQALARLPDEPLLLTGYALALSRHWFFAGEGAAARATGAAERAVRAAPEHGESYLALATVHVNCNRILEAARSLRWALARAPRLAESHELLGHILTETGPMELAMRHLNYALMLDKAVPRVRLSVSRAYALTGQIEAAFSQLQWEGFGAGFGFVRWIVLARFLCWTGDRQRARAYLSDPALAAPELVRPRRLIEFLAGKRHIEVDEYVPPGYQSQSVSPRGHLFGLQLLVEYYCFIGQLPEALHGLRQLAKLALVDIQWVDHCPILAPLRHAPDFPALRAPVAELARQVQDALGINAAG